MFNPFRGIVKADELSPELATKLFIPQASPIWVELQRPLNQIVVGPRGAGKTIALKQLDHKGTPLPTKGPFIGVYIQISRICTIFGNLFPRTGTTETNLPTDHFQQVFADYIWLEIIREIIPILQLHTNESTTTATIRATTGVDTQSFGGLDEYCTQKQLAIETTIQSWAIKKNCSWEPIADLASSVQRCANALRRLMPNLRADSPSLYLLFDESSPIPTECQEVLNGLLHRGRPYCVKLAVRPFEWQTLRTHKGAQIELDTDVIPLYVHYPNELEDDYVSQMRSVANKVLNTHQPDSDHALHDGHASLNIEDILTRDPKVKYSGFREVCAASSGNPQNLLLICSAVFSAANIVPSAVSKGSRIPPARQREVIHMWSKDYEDRNPYSDSRSFCRGLLKLIRESDTKSIGFRYANTEPDLFTADYLPEHVGTKIKSAFSGGFLRNTRPSDTSLFEVPAYFHISRGLLPREDLNLDIPIHPEKTINEPFVHRYAKEPGPRVSPRSTPPETITAFLSTSFSPLLEQQRADIKAALKTVGIICRDVTDQPKHQFLFSDIYKLMTGSDITLLDATILRPYTMFEIGLAAGANKPKPVICIINDNDDAGAISNLHESLQKLSVVPFSYSQERLTKLAGQVFARASDLIATRSEFQTVALTNVSLRPRRRNKTVYVSLPAGSLRDRALDTIKSRLERDGWTTITDADAASYHTNELQTAIQCAHWARVGIIDTSGRDLPDLLQCYKLGLFPGKKSWRVLQTEERGRSHPDVFASVPNLQHFAWTTLDELAEHVATFITKRQVPS